MTPLALARSAFSRRSWLEAYSAFVAADAQSPLDPEDLDRLATVACLIGRDDESLTARTRAHACYLERHLPIRAANSAFWLSFTILDNPAQRAQATGWLARARRLIEEAKEPCVEEGWVLCASAFLRVTERDVDGARAAFSRAVEIGSAFQNNDLLALARHGLGRCMLAMGNTEEGLALLDEVMVAVAGGEIASLVAGVVYCSVISACHDLFDLRRAQEWTTAMQAWCAAQPDLVPFRGYCLIRRSELLQLHGDWAKATAEAHRACERAGGTRQPEAAAGHYQLGELHRLRGELTEAEEAYRLASRGGRKPYPGLALLRLAQGQAVAAASSIRLALQEAREGRTRVPLLRAAVEILLATQDVDGARGCRDELDGIAKQIESPFVSAVYLQAAGQVALAEGDATTALQYLRSAFECWQQLNARFNGAQVRVAIALAYRQLGDHEGAQLELEAAQEVFEQLGAAADAARAGGLIAHGAHPASGGLTGREIEVLRLIATGASNRVIASSLEISEKTVARHISNIFTKLDLNSRAGATAYAYEHKLV